MLGLPPYGRIRASSVLPLRNKLSCQPNDGYLFSNKGWCPRKKTSTVLLIDLSFLKAFELI